MTCNITDFQKQSYNKELTYVPDPIEFSYIGPTSKKQVDVQSRPKTNLKLTNVSLEMTSPICVESNQMTSNAKISFGNLESGPYKITGGDYTPTIGALLDSSIVFENLVIDISLSYIFDPQTICQGKTNVNTKDFNIEIQNVKFEKYYSFEGIDETNIDVDEDLALLLQQKDSPFNVQYLSYMNPLLNNSDFGQQIKKELERVYCNNLKPNQGARDIVTVDRTTEIVLTAFERLNSKMSVMEKLGLMFILSKKSNQQKDP